MVDLGSGGRKWQEGSGEVNQGKEGCSPQLVTSVGNPTEDALRGDVESPLNCSTKTQGSWHLSANSCIALVKFAPGALSPEHFPLVLCSG